MWKTQLCLGTGRDFGLPIDEQIRLFKKTGFEAFFTGWTDAEEFGCAAKSLMRKG